MADDTWQQRLAFVSGYILVFGLALLKIWPVAAMLQTGINVNFWTMNLPSQGVVIELWEFWALTSVIAMALVAIVLAVAHILLHGLSLAFSDPAGAQGLKAGAAGVLNTMRDLTYKGAFFLLPFVAFLVVLDVLMMVAAGLESLLVYRFHLGLHTAGWLSRLAVMLVLLLLFAIIMVKVYPRLSSWLEKASESGARDFAGGLLVVGVIGILLTFMWFLSIQTCCTARMNVAGDVFQRSRNDQIEIHMDLGGATSAPHSALLQLEDARGTRLRTLDPQDLGEGHYVVVVQSHDLAQGRYEVTLTYPHLSMSSLFPFLHWRIVQHRWFMVT